MNSLILHLPVDSTSVDSTVSIEHFVLKKGHFYG